MKGDRSMATGTVRLHRVLRSTPDRVYRAFLDADAMAKWLPPHGFTGKVHHLEARIGGTFKMSFTNFSTGRTETFGGEFLDLRSNELIRHTTSLMTRIFQAKCRQPSRFAGSPVE